AEPCATVAREPGRAMSAPDSRGLEAANATFYERFEAQDLDAMDELWAHGDDVFCVHPGSELVVGWGPVRRSWAAIFAATGYLQFIVTDVRVHAEGAAGWVACTENILSGRDVGGDLDAGKAVATNLFVWHEGAWRMTAHHASPVLRRVAG
ncbi:MAG: nuclear transport factor 2 family protein, partial [Egibacteraceae bacterium]